MASGAAFKAINKQSFSLIATRRSNEQIANPKEVSLELENFGEFFEGKKALLTDKLKELLV